MTNLNSQKLKTNDRHLKILDLLCHASDSNQEFEDIESALSHLFVSMPKATAIAKLSGILEDWESIEQPAGNKRTSGKAVMPDGDRVISPIPDYSLRLKTHLTGKPYSLIQPLVSDLKQRLYPRLSESYQSFQKLWKRFKSQSKRLVVFEVLGVAAILITVMQGTSAAVSALSEIEWITPNPQVVIVGNSSFVTNKSKEWQDWLDRNFIESANSNEYPELLSSSSFNFDLKLIQCDKKANETIHWEPIIRELDSELTREVILVTNSTEAHNFFDLMIGHQLEKKIDYFLPGQTAYSLRGLKKQRRLDCRFGCPSDKTQSIAIREHLEGIDEIERVAIIWDHKNSVYSKKLADRIGKIDKQLMVFGIGETVAGAGMAYVGLDGLVALDTFKAQAVVYLGGSLNTAASLLSYLSSNFDPADQPLVIFSDGIGDKKNINKSLANAIQSYSSTDGKVIAFGTRGEGSTEVRQVIQHLHDFGSRRQEPNENSRSYLLKTFAGKQRKSNSPQFLPNNLDPEKHLSSSHSDMNLSQLTEHSSEYQFGQ